MLMPQMGESITEATVSKWLKNVGDTVEKDEIILEISTDKVDSEIPAPEAGVITEILFEEGATVPVKEKIAVIDTEASAGASTPKAEETKSDTPKEKVTEVKEEVNNSTVEINNESEDYSGNRFYSPLVKGLAEKHGISLSELDSIEGSGQGGRFTKQDFMAYLESKSSAKASAPQVTNNAPVNNSKPAPSDVPSNNLMAGEERIPMDNMRKAIANHMVKSKQTSPHVYSVQEVDVTKIAAWRAKHKAEFKKKEGFNLSFTPFFLEAAVKGLVEFPGINASVDGHTLVLKKHVNLGCAVALGNKGLIVPVIKHAEERNLVGIARSLTDLALRARDKKLMPDDVAGGTFTVTNPGVFGTLIGTPIINQPQVAILCLGAIEKRPVVVDDMIAIRQRCYLTLSYDHRVVDGSLGGQYLKFITDYLENWDSERSLY
ncbi:UNVERIFIED_CONTAM: hypothetical protein GTU68_054597 [Idotea baltica]|nr:hypothetical protein [Idotea baltica]